MKKYSILLAVSAIACLALVDPAAGAGSTALGYSKTDGYHVTGKTTDKWGSHDATPTVQQAATMTADKVCQVKGLKAAGGDYSVQHATVNLTAANLIAMYAAPVALIAAPGAGKSIAVTRLAFTITRTSTAFTGGGAAIVQYGATVNGGGLQSLDSTLAATVITGSATTTATFRNGAVISDSATPINAGLYISNATAAFAAGTGTAVVDIWYVVVGGA